MLIENLCGCMQEGQAAMNSPDHAEKRMKDLKYKRKPF